MALQKQSENGLRRQTDRQTDTSHNVNVDAFWRQFACMSFDVGGDWAVLLDECKTSLRDGDEDNGRRYEAWFISWSQMG